MITVRAAGRLQPYTTPMLCVSQNTSSRSGLIGWVPATWLAVLLPTLALFVLPAPTYAESPEQTLVDRYAPIAFLSEQTVPCDPDGEPWVMAPIDIVFTNENVEFRAEPDYSVIREGVTGPVLFERGDGYYVDFPGNARTPTCGYELDAREAMKGYEPTVYAHIAHEEGKQGLVIQYWFYWWFNDFNNKHESDWEMIQILFDVNTVEEALRTDPVEVAYSQHEGGEAAEWDAPKLDREGTRPIVYPSKGSHAAYYGPAIWVGWGDQGSGLGCDDTQSFERRIDPQVVLVPDDVASITDPESPFAWLTYQGRWGERNWKFYNGPTGPAMKERWTEPITWQEGIRRSSVALYRGPSIGPSTSDVFCGIIGTSSGVVTLLGPYPVLVISSMGLLLATVVALFYYARDSVNDAWRIYRRTPWVFIRIGLLLAPITLLGSALRWALNSSSSFAARLPFDEDNPAILMVFNAEKVIQWLLFFGLVGPMVIWSTRELVNGRQPGFRSSFRAVKPRIIPVLVTHLLNIIGLTLLFVGIIGIPYGVNRLVRWHFGPHAATLDDVAGAAALKASSSATKKRWWQLGIALIVLIFLGAATGPIVGIILLVGPKVQVDIANGIGSIVYSITQPFAVIGTTLLYLAGRPRIEELTTE